MAGRTQVVGATWSGFSGEHHRTHIDAQVGQAIDELMAWPLRVTQVRGLFADAWRLRANVTFADALYIALAEHLGADVLSDDARLANTPRLPVRVLRLP